jgi:polyvinyl alcohol dehydrogenase (cytochrome)
LGVQQYGPSGAPIWSSPTIDVARNRLYFGTGQNYSSPADHNSDAIHAIDLATGERIWRTQFLAEDSWNPACNFKWLSFNCPDEDGPDYDFGAPPILATLEDGRQLLLAGQKSGMVFAINPDTGDTVWMQSVGRGGTLGGVHWGMAADHQHLYVPISDLNIWGINTPGEQRPSLNRLDLASGETVWRVPAIFNCNDADGDLIDGCRNGLSAALTLIPGAVFAPGLDGVLRAHRRDSGAVIWQYDTKQTVMGVNGLEGEGGTLDAGGAVVADGQVFINSGYGGIISAGSKGGNVFLVFGKKAAE